MASTTERDKLIEEKMISLKKWRDGYATGVEENDE